MDKRMDAHFTDLFAASVESDKANEIGRVTNAEFLQAVFDDKEPNARPIIVSFHGNPSSVPGAVWNGAPWASPSDGGDSLSADANNYFSLAAFNPCENGVYRRRKAQFQALHAVMLDDWGSKVPIDRLSLPPSWILETSPGNFQVGYLLKSPLADGTLADRLMKAIVAAELCDPGAGGPRARLARLPVAVNGKHTPPFRCRLT